MQSHRVKQPGIQSDVPMLYNKGGIEYDKTDMTLSIKGWRDKGIARFSAPVDQVKENRAENSQFERCWLEANQKAQAEDGATPKKCKCQLPQARLELFDLEDEDSIVPVMDEAPMEQSGSESGKETG
jgi:hypothetical protein